MKVIIGIIIYLIICVLLSGGNTDVAVTLFWGIPVLVVVFVMLYNIANRFTKKQEDKKQTEKNHTRSDNMNYYNKPNSVNHRRYAQDTSKPKAGNKSDIEFETYTVQTTRGSKYTSQNITALSFPYRKINQMRKLENKYIQNKPAYYILCDDEIFINQAKFMSEFTDNYNKNIEFMQYRPTYNNMTNEQLRVYFTWRTNVRKLVVKNISLSYFYVYVYELINNVHAGTCEDTIKKLIYIWTEFRKFDTSVDRYLVGWVKDYYIVNALNCSFVELIVENNIDNFYPTVMKKNNIDNIPFDYFTKLSKYKYQKSKFLDNNSKKLLTICFYSVLKELSYLFDSYNINVSEILIGEIQTDNYWSPFNGAVYNKTNFPDKKVYICDNEYYEILNDNIAHYHPILDTANTSLFIGYLIKHIEAKLRELSGYKSKLRPSHIKLINELSYRSNSKMSMLLVAINDSLFIEILDRTIEREYNEFYNRVSGDEDEYRAIVNSKLPLNDFKDMRKQRDKSTRYNSEVRNFYIQGIRMKNFEYIDEGKLKDEVNKINFKPIMYSNMTNNQLAHYFNWRTLYKKGKIIDTNKNNIELYISELINDIHGLPPNVVVLALTGLLKNYEDIVPDSRDIIVKTIKDYYICNDINMRFVQLIHQFNIENYYPDVMLINELSEEWHSLCFEYSQYKVMSSKFYDSKTKAIIEECFNYLIKDISKYFKESGLDLNSLLLGRGKPKEFWNPYNELAYYYRSPNNIAKNITKKISNYEVYEFDGNSWYAVCLPTADALTSRLLGYIIKCMEKRMREILKFKYKLSINTDSFVKWLNVRSRTHKKVSYILLNENLKMRIEDSVNNFFRENYPRLLVNPDRVYIEPIIVDINIKEVEKARKVANENTEKLAVEDSFIEDDTNVIQEELSNNEDRALLKTEIEAILIILKSDDPYNKLSDYCKKNNQMVEVLVENINEKLYDEFGDSVIELEDKSVHIYSDYIEDIESLVRR